MSKTKPLNYTLLCATALGSLILTQPAAAQSDAQIQAIEKQIKELQSQLGQVKADLATRDRALKAAQQQAKAAHDQAEAAATEAAAASTRAAQAAAAPRAQVVEAPAPPPGPPLPKGAFKVGELTVTLGGFAALEGSIAHAIWHRVSTPRSTPSRCRTARTTTCPSTARRRSKAVSR